MDIRELETRLLAAARADTPSDRVPYGFETRIMALIAGQTPVDIWAFWSRVLWRAAAPCVALSVALCIWAAVAGGQANQTGDNLAVQLESTILAPLARLDESW